MQQTPVLYGMIDDNENILWEGKPNLKCFILESIFNPLLPFALVWALFDGFFIFMLTHGEAQKTNPTALAIPLIAFFTLHLMPVWIYLGGVFLSYSKHKHTTFVVTDKGVYVSGGIFTQTYEHKPFDQIVGVNIKRGFFDQLLGVGDVELVLPLTEPELSYQKRTTRKSITICDIPDFQSVYELIKELQQKQHA